MTFRFPFPIENHSRPRYRCSMMNAPLNRRHFLQISALAAGSAFAPSAASAAQTLPALPYGFAALEPHIDAMTMEIHHGKHHAAYIKNLNAALDAAPDLAAKALPDLLADLPSVQDDAVRNTVRNNGGGHWNHDFFWKIMTPPANSGAPSAELGSALQTVFGSVDDFKKAFAEAGTKRFGSGWAWLIVQDGKLKVVSTPNQDNPVMKGIVPDTDLGTPILGLDVWEHAYYLHYQNRRPDYITAWWNVVNWPAVSALYASAAK
jgi:Fe-Mn family superoxide dismutase